MSMFVPPHAHARSCFCFVFLLALESQLLENVLQNETGKICPFLFCKYTTVFHDECSLGLASTSPLLLLWYL